MSTLSVKESLDFIVRRHKTALDQSFTGPQLEVLEKITREMIRTLKASNKILFCGNGGSAADSQHIAAEFIARFKKERKSLAAMALTTDTSILTAVANDYSFDEVFARQVEGLGVEGDLLIAISTSGNSRNVLNAVKKAKEHQMFTVGFTGTGGGPLAKAVDLCYHAQAKETSHIQEMHITALHAISEIVEEIFFGA